jgi:hypothetical protein
MSTTFERIKGWFRRAAGAVEEEVEGGEPVTTPPPGADHGGLGDGERETSTNAQTGGAAGEPWPGNT